MKEYDGLVNTIYSADFSVSRVPDIAWMKGQLAIKVNILRTKLRTLWSELKFCFKMVNIFKNYLLNISVSSEPEKGGREDASLWGWRRSR